MPAITIRYIRSGPDAPDQDDTLRITYSHCNPETQETITKCVFTPGDQSKKKGQEFYATSHELMVYLSLTFKLLRRDDDPYDSVQVDLPVYPQFLFMVSNFKNTKQNLILRAVASVVFDWPSFASESKECNDNACGRYYASCDCMEVENDA